MKLVNKAGTQTFTQLVETAGLDSPFDENALREISQAAERYLKDFSI